MKEIQEVVIGYARDATDEVLPPHQVVTKPHPIRKDAVVSILEGVKGETLRITLSNGKKIEIELWEHEEGFIGIRSDSQMVVKPDASNSIQVGHE